VHQPLARHAADVGASASVHPLGLLDEHNALPKLAQVCGGGLSALAPADDEDIRVETVVHGVHSVKLDS
jgi:hypothetical protein